MHNGELHGHSSRRWGAARSSNTVMVFAATSLIVLTAATAAAAPMRDEVREVAPFTEIVARGAYSLEVHEGAGQSVILTAEQDDLDRIDTEVRNGTLYIDKDGWGNIGRIKVVVEVGRLERLSIQGAANTQIDGIEGHDLELSLAGAGRIDAAGTCPNVSVDIKGAGTIDAHALACDRVQVEIMGSGDAAVHASDEVIVSIFGAGRVDVYGDPARVVPAKIRGAATVELR